MRPGLVRSLWPKLGGIVKKTSIDERFVGNNASGIAAWGALRHENIFGPSKGNSVRMKIVSPTFKDNGLRDVDVEGGSAYDTLPVNAKDATTFRARDALGSISGSMTPGLTRSDTCLTPTL